MSSRFGSASPEASFNGSGFRLSQPKRYASFSFEKSPHEPLHCTRSISSTLRVSRVSGRDE
jgi:hypothetical protein